MSKHICWDEVWNPVTGCNDDKISAACAHCISREMAETLRGKFGYPTDEPFRVTVHRDRFDAPLKWRKPRRIFVCSMGDLFHEDVPPDVVYQVASSAYNCSRHTFLICTKRPERMADASDWIQWGDWEKKNVHLGTTVEHQDTVDRIGHLLDAPAAVHWISCEPLLGPVNLGATARLTARNERPQERYIQRLDWIVIGCETGPNRRPCKLETDRPPSS